MYYAFNLFCRRGLRCNCTLVLDPSGSSQDNRLKDKCFFGNFCNSDQFSELRHGQVICTWEYQVNSSPWEKATSHGLKPTSLVGSYESLNITAQTLLSFLRSCICQTHCASMYNAATSRETHSAQSILRRSMHWPHLTSTPARQQGALQSARGFRGWPATLQQPGNCAHCHCTAVQEPICQHGVSAWKTPVQHSKYSFYWMCIIFARSFV